MARVTESNPMAAWPDVITVLYCPETSIMDSNSFQVNASISVSSFDGRLNYVKGKTILVKMIQ